MRRKARALLTVGGILCLGWCLFSATDAATYQRLAASATRRPQGASLTAKWNSALYAKLEIPALRFASAVVEGTDSTSLQHGVGHIAGTAVPGGLGNVGLAGHRDTVFRPLRNIAKHMEIRLTNAEGTYHYFVDSVEIVSPDSTNVLGISNTPELTLVTCYPFDFVGSAPKRFVVHASLRSALADGRNLKN